MRERRQLLSVLLVSSVLIGLWALVFPAAFHADFPLGRAWVATDGPYNEHLVRDVGALNLAFAVLVRWVMRDASDANVRVTASVALVYGVPHLLYHATHLGPFGLVDAVGQTLSLLLLVVVPLRLLWLTKNVPVVSRPLLRPEP